MPASDTPFASRLAEQLKGRRLNLVEFKHSPREIFFAGDSTLLRAVPSVSVVGSRKATDAGLSFAAELSRWLVAHGAVVVSGLAEGIDTAAHVAALEASGRTVAVLGTPLDQCYPARNRALQHRIMREHLALSQFAVGVPSRPANFPMRNRTMALLSDATVIAEATENSGSLHQGWEALRLGRPLFIAARMLDDPHLTWPREFQQYGAQSLSEADFGILQDFLPEPDGVAHAGAAA